jgi:hypothetical protein
MDGAQVTLSPHVNIATGYGISGGKRSMLESYAHIAPYDAAAMHAASGTHGVTHEEGMW